MILIKKYSNRRFYDTDQSNYVNLQQIADRIRAGQQIKVVDAKEGDDLTQQVLLQILLDVQGDVPLLPASMLHRIIRGSSGNPLQRLAMTQLATGLQLLEKQLAAFDTSAWQPPPSPTASTPQAPDEVEDDDENCEPDAEPTADPPVDAELSALRDRLAALEQRLKK